MQKSIIIGLIVALLLSIFAIYNAEEVPVDFVIGKEVEAPLSLLLLITIIIGVILGVIFSIPSINKQTKIIQQKNKEIDRLQSLVEEYKKGNTPETQEESKEEGEKKGKRKKERRR